MADRQLQRVIGWNSLLTEVPAAWHPAVVYQEYLLFEEDHLPVCALKWQQPKGRFDPTAILRRFDRDLRSCELSSWQPPRDWNSLLSPFLHKAFTWTSEGQCGRGLLLYDRPSGRVVLVQIYENGKTEIEQFTRLLASLQIHQQETRPLWSIFDIRFRLPGSARLLEHEFLPGSFRLRFSCQDQDLTLYRFKPAAILLENQSLGDFGRKMAATAMPIHREQGEVDWRQIPSGWQSLIGRLRRRPSCLRMRLRHVADRNIILGLRARGNRMIPEEEFNRLCSDYTPC